MTLQEIYQQFLSGIRNITVLELVAVVAGIASVWFSRIENILVYPVGLISTVSYVYISFEYHLAGAIAGVLSAVLLRRRDPLPPRKRYSWEDEPEFEPAGDGELELPRAQEVPVLWRRSEAEEQRGRVIELRPRDAHADRSRPTLH